MDKKEREWLLQEKYQGKECPAFFRDLKKLESGIPLAYVIGWVDFLGAKIGLESKPLIPRVETEWWVERMIHDSRFRIQETNVLDIFAGSGCIGIAILKNVPGTRVDFAEKSAKHAKQIEKNLELNRFADFDRPTGVVPPSECLEKITSSDKSKHSGRGYPSSRLRAGKPRPATTNIFISDIFSNIPLKKYDYIFANPPYISKEKIEQVQDTVLAHEPKSALFAKDDGLFFIKKLLAEAPKYLGPDGKLFIEFDAWQKPEIEKLAPEAEFWKDQYGEWRVVIVQF